jgi:hypothetical protein
MHHEPADEVHVATEPIQLGDPEGTPVLLSVRQRGSELYDPRFRNRSDSFFPYQSGLSPADPFLARVPTLSVTSCRWSDVAAASLLV